MTQGPKALFQFRFEREHAPTMLRMVGGKVPSIYGPSGDEPWR